MVNSQSIYDAITEFNNSIGMSKDLIEVRANSLMDKFVRYVNKWIFYNEIFSDNYCETPDIVKYLFNLERSL